MVAPATLLLTALASTPRAPVSEYERPVCVEPSAIEDAATAPVEIASDGEESIGMADDCEPTPLPPVVDCNDARMTVWVQEMIGSCDMPRAGASLAKGRDPAPRPSAACDGTGCGHDRMPLGPARAAADPSQSLALAAADPALAFPSTRIAVDEPLLPRTAFAARLERPPRA